MNVTQSLLDFILNLMRDGDAKAAFVADPERALADAGLSNVCSEDVSDAMSYVSEYHPVTFVGDRDYNVGHTSVSQHASSHRSDDYRGDEDRGYRPEHHDGDSHAAAVRQLDYITNNYSYTDSHDTVIDKSVNQNIWNKGDLSQHFDDHSVTATDHSVAAGRDINGDVANGNDNVVGHDNNVGNTIHSDNHAITDSFHSTNIADHGGIAGNDNDGNATNAHNSNVATNGSKIDNSTHSDDSRTEINSHNSKSISDTDSHDHTVRIENHPETTITDSGNGSHNEDSQIDQSHIQQHGLVNVDHVLSDNHTALDLL
jgi:hypothetical protein